MIGFSTFATAPRLLRQAGAASPDSPSSKSVEIREGSYWQQWLAMKESYVQVRGAIAAANNKVVPRTSNDDVKRVIRYWTDAVNRYGSSKGADRSSRARWFRQASRFLGEIKRRNAAGSEEFFANEEFWQTELWRVAIWLDSLSAIVPAYRMVYEAIAEAAFEAPGRVASGVSSAADSVGSVVAAPVKGFARSLGVTPLNLLISLAAVGGVGYLVFARSRK